MDKNSVNTRPDSSKIQKRRSPHFGFKIWFNICLCDLAQCRQQSFYNSGQLTLAQEVFDQAHVWAIPA